MHNIARQKHCFLAYTSVVMYIFLQRTGWWDRCYGTSGRCLLHFAFHALTLLYVAKGIRRVIFAVAVLLGNFYGPNLIWNNSRSQKRKVAVVVAAEAVAVLKVDKLLLLDVSEWYLCYVIALHHYIKIMVALQMTSDLNGSLKVWNLDFVWFSDKLCRRSLTDQADVWNGGCPQLGIHFVIKECRGFPKLQDTSP